MSVCLIFICSTIKTHVLYTISTPNFIIFFTSKGKFQRILSKSNLQEIVLAHNNYAKNVSTFARSLGLYRISLSYVTD